MIKKYFSPISLLISTIVLLYIFYRSEIFWSGEKPYYYFRYYVISGILIFLSLISFLISEKIKLYLLISISSIFFSLYLYEGYLTLISEKPNTNLKVELYKIKTGKNYDQRTKFKIYKDLKKTNKNIVVSMLPSIYLNDKNLDVLPLAGISNTKTIHCNNNGYFSIYESDRYGFNNPDEEWDKEEIEYLIVGDSYAHGACVNRPNDIASVLRTLSKKSVTNLGYQGNGPLLEYAILREYLKSNVKNVVWLYYEANDNRDLYNELKSEILLKYLNDKNFKQNLEKKQSLVNKVLKSKLDLAEEMETKRERKDKNKTKKLYDLTEFLKFYKTRFKYVGQMFPENELKEILKASKELSINNGSNFYVVYMPAYARYKFGTKKNINKTFSSIINELEIKMIDIDKEVFKKEENVFALFPFELPGHYNEEGYKKTAEAIHRIISN